MTRTYVFEHGVPADGVSGRGEALGFPAILADRGPGPGDQAGPAGKRLTGY